LQLNLNSMIGGGHGRIKPEFPEESHQFTRQPVLTGFGWIRFVSVVFGVGAAYFVVLLFRHFVLGRARAPVSLGFFVFDGFALTVMSFLLWRYAGAVRDYADSGEAGARQLERAHIDLWRWGAIFLAAHLVVVGVVMLVMMRF
jgi:hypothetical protein